ncbi:Glutamine transport ATP-binding protein GlnQ [Pandoraea captiosa]|uniref:Glutamine transport ATP-binding protein GlnQ n=1 Tax=Pandoraea captiosa TaxID=2508302 RepID=A0A5E5ASG9_9BURK|nr:ATP-binding cassette domain-containing protein [Pandoraea captiosa]VVE75926.1 Glutamine transport ATP-binding protein GlnQ [Pandoraea captiosa]
MTKKFGDMPGEAASIIEARGISRMDAQRNARLIAETDFELRAGERVTISGPSGAGKSVILRALGMLDSVDSGELRWRGRKVTRNDVPLYRRHIAYVRQRPAMIDGTVADNLRLPYGFAAYRDVQFDERRAETLADQAGRGDGFLERNVRDLSGGEAQIVALMRVLQLSPDVLLLDEPTAALDPESARAVELLVTQWFEAGEAARAAVWVSHDPAQAQRVGDLHYTMRAGVLASPSQATTSVPHD